MFHSGRAVQKLFYIGVQRLGKFRQHFHVRPGPAGLIVGYGLTGDVEHLRQLILTDVPLLPQRADVFSNIPHRRYLPAAFMGASEKRCMDKPLFLLLF